MSERQLQVHIFRTRSLNNYKYFFNAQMLLDEVEKRDEQWKKECSYETIKDYYILKSEIAESWMNYTESIRIIKEFLVPLTTENEKDNLHAEYLLAKANCFGNRKVRAYYMLNDIVGNSSHSVEDRILSYLHLAWIFITISSNKAVDDHILKARKLINENKEQLGTDSQYFELLCLFEECNKFQKFKFEYKCRKKLNIIIYDSLSILKSSNDEKYYQLIFKVLHMLNCTQIGIIEYNKILLHLKTPHFWNLFNNQEQIDPSTRYEIIFGKVARIVNMFLIYFTCFVIQILRENIN